MKKTNICNRCFNHHATGSAAAHHYRAGKKAVYDRKWWGDTEQLFAQGYQYFWARRMTVEHTAP